MGLLTPYLFPNAMVIVTNVNIRGFSVQVYVLFIPMVMYYKKDRALMRKGTECIYSCADTVHYALDDMKDVGYENTSKAVKLLAPLLLVAITE